MYDINFIVGNSREYKIKLDSMKMFVRKIWTLRK